MYGLLQFNDLKKNTYFSYLLLHIVPLNFYNPTLTQIMLSHTFFSLTTITADLFEAQLTTISYN